jgi:hypothetical protein
MQTFHAHERPCAAPGLTSYRIRGVFGWIMIGAHSIGGALDEARRSTQFVDRSKLQVWSETAGKYIDA